MLMLSRSRVGDPVKFYNWRRAILYMKFKCFNIASSIIAKLAKFTPLSWDDPSLRVVETKALCAPVFLLTKINLYAVPQQFYEVN